MANLVEAAEYEAGIYQLEETDPVQGGAGGIDNQQAQQLANRTAYLKEQTDALNTHAGTVDEEIAAHDGRIGTLEGHATTVDGEITTLNAHATTVDGEVAAIDDRVSALENRVTSGTVLAVPSGVATVLFNIGSAPGTYIVQVNLGGPGDQWIGVWIIAIKTGLFDSAAGEIIDLAGNMDLAWDQPTGNVKINQSSGAAADVAWTYTKLM